MKSAEKYKSQKLEFLDGIKLRALLLQNNRQSVHMGEVILVEAEIEELVNAFYGGCADIISRDQYETALKDFAYFLTLIDSALSRCKE